MRYYIDLEASEERIAADISDTEQAGVVIYRIAKDYTLQYDRKCGQWYVDSDDEPSWFSKHELKVGLVSVTYNNLPYDPRGCSPYMGVYNRSESYPKCTAVVDAYVTPEGAAAISIVVTSPADALEKYYSAIRSHKVAPDIWLQPVPSHLVSE